MMQQRAALTSEDMVRVGEEVLEVEVVGIKLAPSLSNLMVSTGKDFVVDDGLSFSSLIRLVRRN